ncbi:hypothetical protein C8R45DRAFT_941274 [Mycena sanguinolenta]|nr:hypothetical protein C8R45DRAFT_941274 [Mycena sanguinolenta]
MTEPRLRPAKICLNGTWQLESHDLVLNHVREKYMQGPGKDPRLDAMGWRRDTTAVTSRKRERAPRGGRCDGIKSCPSVPAAGGTDGSIDGSTIGGNPNSRILWRKLNKSGKVKKPPTAAIAARGGNWRQSHDFQFTNR